MTLKGWSGVSGVRDPITGERKQGETLRTVARDNGWDWQGFSDGLMFFKDGRRLYLEFDRETGRRYVRIICHEALSCGLRLSSVTDAFRFLRGEKCICPTREADNGIDVEPDPECPFTHPRLGA